MKKVNNRGFMLVETLIVATLIISILIYLFIQFQTITKSYNASFTYNTVDAVYGVSNIRNFILTDGYDKLVSYLNSSDVKYIDITNCNSNYFNEGEYCLSLFNQLNVKTVIFTNNNLIDFKNENLTFNDKFKKYINYITYTSEVNTYRIIVEYNNGTFGSLKLPFECGIDLVDSRDNNVYKTVKIGRQCWMAEDLRYDCSLKGYTNAGTGTSWSGTNNCGNQGVGYTGVLYQWSVAMNGSTAEGNQGLCPSGWHIPTDVEWIKLETNSGGSSVAGTKLKSTTWDGTDDYDFNVLPTGFRDVGGPLYDVGSYNCYWTSSISDSNAWIRYMYTGSYVVHRDNYSQARGYSIRCVLGQ